MAAVAPLVGEQRQLRVPPPLLPARFAALPQRLRAVVPVVEVDVLIPPRRWDHRDRVRRGLVELDVALTVENPAQQANRGQGLAVLRGESLGVFSWDASRDLSHLRVEALAPLGVGHAV